MCERWSRGGLFLSVILLFQLGWAIDARAQKEDDYPNRAIQLIIPWGPGVDMGDRIIARYMETYLKQPIVVVNKPGAGGIIGHSIIAKSKPDGYTLGRISTLFGIYLLLYKDLEFEFDSFTPICAYSKGSGFFLVRADAPWKTMKEFVAEAKKNPSKLRYGSIGVGSAAHILGVDFCNKAGIKATHIPYAGMAEVMNALLGGHVDIAPSWGSLGHLKGGKIRALAVSEKERREDYPDIPTLTELGYPIVIYPVRGHCVPKGTPKKIVDKLARAYQEVLNANKAEIVESLKKTEEIAVILGPDEYYKRMKEDYEYMREVFKGIEIK